MKTCDCAYGWGFVVGTFVCGCAWGPVPITVGVGGYGFEARATVVIPQKPATVVPVVAIPNVSRPTLMVPTGSSEGVGTAAAVNAKGLISEVPVVEAPVSVATLAVPKN